MLIVPYSKTKVIVLGLIICAVPIVGWAIGMVVIARAVFLTNALEVDSKGLSVTTLFRTYELSWEEYRDATEEQHSIKLWGVIPIFWFSNLVIESKGGIFGDKKFRIGHILLATNSSASEIAAQVKQLARETMPMLNLGSDLDARVAVDRATATMDADAAIARYKARQALTNREPSPALPPIGTRPPASVPMLNGKPMATNGFGRRGL
jgi:hypothetical protein